jgi:hypothetical protein
MGTATDGNSLDVSTADVVPHRTPSSSSEAPALVRRDLTALLADLEQPGLILSDGYIGPNRRSTGLWRRLRRAVFGRHRRLLSVEFLVMAVATASVVGSLVVAHSVGGPGPSAVREVTTSLHADGRVASSAGAVATAPSTTVAAPSAVPSTGTAAPVVSTPAAAPVALAAAPAAAPAATPAATPDQLGAEALTLVRYPWQSIPGYSIRFLPIGDAPSAGFLGNTSFTWGQKGGVSSLYVYPGESVEKLAGIIAFEIGHEVDAAAVEPQGGEAAIEAILGVHPASWAPNCDCSEQVFLSGWYAAAFSNYWSPGVGNWSTLAPEPSGSELAAVEPWLNPTIP